MSGAVACRNAQRQSYTPPVSTALCCFGREPCPALAAKLPYVRPSVELTGVLAVCEVSWLLGSRAA